MRSAPARSRRGFTLLEILVAMAIFTVLGTMVVYFLRQSLNIFAAGTKESGFLDRMDMTLPQVRADLIALTVPFNTDPPPPEPTEAELERLGQRKPPPPPPVVIRLRAGYIFLRNIQASGPEAAIYKQYPCPYIAFVIADAGEWSDKLKRRAGNAPKAVGGQKPLTPRTVEQGDKDSAYLATGGLTEVCWIAIPQDLARPPPTPASPRYPAILTLYRGFRTPIGDKEKSLLDPRNLDTVEKIKAACTVKAEDLLHFSAIWRRTFATEWDGGPGPGVGETAPYVGPIWDSTRGIEKNWPLYKGKESRHDPSDDVFPAFVQLEATLAPSAQTGAGRGELSLRAGVGVDDVRLLVTNIDALVQPNLGKDRWVKVGHEWMRYRIADVDYNERAVRVQRGMRGTKATTHDAGDWCYVGMPSRLQMRLPVFLDRYVVQKGLGGR